MRVLADLFVFVSVCLTGFGSVVSAQTVSFITPCKASDSACLKTSAQKAVPFFSAGIQELGMAPLDPLELPLVKTDQAGLKLEFRKTIVKGLRNCEVLSIKRQGSKHIVELKCSVNLTGNYTIGGRLLVLPIEGDGKYLIKIRDIVVKVQYEVSEKTKNDKKFWVIDSWKYSSDVKTGAEFLFQNLFNGNKQLSDTIHQFANSNWRDIFQEVAPPIIKAIVAKIIGEVNKFYSKVPLAELVLN